MGCLCKTYPDHSFLLIEKVKLYKQKKIKGLLGFFCWKVGFRLNKITLKIKRWSKERLLFPIYRTTLTLWVTTLYLSLNHITFTRNSYQHLVQYKYIYLSIYVCYYRNLLSWLWLSYFLSIFKGNAYLFSTEKSCFLPKWW